MSVVYVAACPGCGADTIWHVATANTPFQQDTPVFTIDCGCEDS